MKEALFYTKLDRMKVQCKLCPNQCVIMHGKRGRCHVRENQGGVLYAVTYGKPCTTAIDPIEKKPLFHFLPKSHSFSIATVGCNFSCRFCQNWEISQSMPEDIRSVDMSPEEVVRAAKQTGCDSIAYTYVEPTVFYEYMLDIAMLARKEGIKNVMVTNGYINQAPLKKLCRYMDAANVDLKGFTEEYYREICGGKLKPVLETIKTMQKEGVWLELTTLVVPGHNDDADTLRKMYDWVKKNLGTDVPLHISRFYPCYKMAHLEPTPQETLEQAYSIAKAAGHKYVYVGNIEIPDREDTFCPKCGKKLINRTRHFEVKENKLKAGKCYSCGTKLNGVWEKK